MKSTKYLLSAASIALLAGAYVTANVAYAEGRGHKDGDRKEARKGDKEHKGERHDEHKGRKEEHKGEYMSGADDDIGKLSKGTPHPVILSNLGKMPLQEIEIKFSGANRDDFRQTNNCGEELKQKSSCTINVMFMPSSPGQKNAIMEVHTSGGNQVVYLSGTGV